MTDKKKRIRELTIDRRKWLRGEGVRDSYLLRAGDNKMCCIGFYCTNLLNLPRRAIMSTKTIYDTQLMRPDIHEIIEDGPLSKEQGVTHDVMQFEFYNPNDSIALTDEEREEILIRNFKKHGIKVKFVN